MYTDLLCANNTITINIKLAKIVGLPAAVYCAEVLNVIKEVVRKKKYDADGFFKLDRKYIEDRTTLTLEEQFDCDSTLGNLGIIEIAPEDTSVIRLFSDKLFTLLLDDNLDSLTETRKKKIKTDAAQKAANKRQAIVANMQNIAMGCSIIPEVQTALCAWVESVYANKKYLTKAAIDLFWGTISNYTTDTGIRIALINAAMANAYTNADWVIGSYARDHKVRPAATTLPVQETATTSSIDFSQKF